MNRFPRFLIALSLSTLTFAQQPTPPTSSAKEPSGVETASARVVQVFKALDDGFQSISYEVVYHNQHVIIQDPLCTTDYSVGDKIYFLVMRHDMSKSHSDGKKLLSFMAR